MPLAAYILIRRAIAAAAAGTLSEETLADAMNPSAVPAQPVDRYTDVAIALHWLLAVSLLAAFCVGLYMADLKLSPTRIRLFNWHKWAGISILVLSAFRLGWRLAHRPPAEPSYLPAWQRRLAAAVHHLLYLLFFLVPIAGWAHSSAAGFPVVWFGIIHLPDLVGVDKQLAETLADVHSALAFTLGGLVLLHVAGALQHRFVLKDDIVQRMLPGRRP
jgi:cytochrome b561